MSYVAFLCHQFCFFRGSDFHPCKMRDKKNRFNCGDCCADDRSPAFFLGNRVDCRICRADYPDQRADICVPHALIFLHEGINVPKAAAAAMIAAGIYLMIEKKDKWMGANGDRGTGSGGNSRKGWMLYAAGSAVFASLTAILGKIGIAGVESNLGTAIRTCVVLVMAWGMVLATGKQQEVRRIDRKELLFICLSGIATGASWLCYYRALQEGPASVVAPVDKLSVLVTVVFSYLVFGEKLSRKALAGLVLLTAGTVAMAVL